MDMIASIADCYSKGTLGAEDAYLLVVRVIEGSLICYRITSHIDKNGR